MNPTIEKFGYPKSLIKEFEHWVILVRPTQVTLGSLVLAAKSHASAYGELPPAAFAEQAEAVAWIETSLKRLVSYERINYLMLMMVDPQVHFHVIPRYSSTRRWSGVEFPDTGWPGPPNLGAAVPLNEEQIRALVTEFGTNLD